MPSFLSQLMTSNEKAALHPTSTAFPSTSAVTVPANATTTTTATALPMRPNHLGTGMPGLSGMPGLPRAANRPGDPLKLGLLQIPRAINTSIATSSSFQLPIRPVAGGKSIDLESASTTSSSSASSPTSSSSSSSTTPDGKHRWNDNEKMQDFFLHIKDPELIARADDDNNKLINIRELVAKNSTNSSANKMKDHQKPEEPATPEHDEATPSKPSAGGGLHNALAEMLAKNQRAGVSTNETAASKTEKANPIAEMLAKRNQLSQPNEEASPKKKPHSALADMLAKRSPTPPPPQTNGETADDRKSKRNVLADMLSKRSQPPPTEDTSSADNSGSKRNALSEMLAKRNQPTSTESPSKKKESMNPLAAMLARRQAGPPQPEPAAAKPNDESSPKTDDDQTPLKEHPKYKQYFKMLKIGHPPPVVQHKMRQDGLDPSIIELDPEKPLPAKHGSVGGDAEDVAAEAEFHAQMKEYNEKFPKYRNMLKVGLPRPVVEHKMRMEGADPAWLDGPPVKKQKAAPAQPVPPTEEEIAAHREKYAKYFTMLRMGLPRGAVEQKMRMAGVDPKELDGPQPKVPATAASAVSAKPQIKRAQSIRKKLHWEVIKHAVDDRAHRDSLWSSSSQDTFSEVRISAESKELLEKLFVKAVAEPKKKPVAAKKNNADDKKKSIIVLIDMKKSQNIAITLARVKMEFPQLKREILAMNPTVLSTAQLQALIDMWPDRKEQEAVDSYHGDVSLLGSAEQFLVETRNVPRFKEKLGCLVFKQEFPSRVHEIRESINLVIRGVHQVCSSQALRQVFIYILQIGNLLNFGTEAENAAVDGFSLGSLVKLSQTKAFLGGITFLQYVVQSIERDVPQLARFYEQITLVSKCSKVSLPMLLTEKKSLEAGLNSLRHEAQVVTPTTNAEDSAEAELARSILQHFASEVEHDLEAVDELLEQMDQSKTKFLEYFEEDDSGEELNALMAHLANFTDEYRREHLKYLETKRQQELKEQKAAAAAQNKSATAGKGQRRENNQRHHSHGHNNDHHIHQPRSRSNSHHAHQKQGEAAMSPSNAATACA